MANEIKAGNLDTPYRAEAHKQSDRTPFGDGNASNPLHKRDLGDKAHDAVEHVADGARAVGHAAQEAGEGIVKKAQHAHEAVSEFVKSNPTTSVLLALGIGAIIARMLPQR